MRHRELLFLLTLALLPGLVACQPATPGLLDQGPADGAFVLNPAGKICFFGLDYLKVSDLVLSL